LSDPIDNDEGEGAQPSQTDARRGVQQKRKGKAEKGVIRI